MLCPSDISPKSNEENLGGDSGINSSDFGENRSSARLLHQIHNGQVILPRPFGHADFARDVG